MKRHMINCLLEGNIRGFLCEKVWLGDENQGCGFLR